MAGSQALQTMFPLSCAHACAQILLNLLIQKYYFPCTKSQRQKREYIKEH